MSEKLFHMFRLLRCTLRPKESDPSPKLGKWARGKVIDWRRRAKESAIERKQYVKQRNVCLVLGDVSMQLGITAMFVSSAVESEALFLTGLSIFYLSAVYVWFI